MSRVRAFLQQAEGAEPAVAGSADIDLSHSSADSDSDTSETTDDDNTSSEEDSHADRDGATDDENDEALSQSVDQGNIPSQDGERSATAMEPVVRKFRNG